MPLLPLLLLPLAGVAVTAGPSGPLLLLLQIVLGLPLGREPAQPQSSHSGTSCLFSFHCCCCCTAGPCQNCCILVLSQSCWAEAPLVVLQAMEVLWRPLLGTVAAVVSSADLLQPAASTEAALRLAGLGLGCCCQRCRSLLRRCSQPLRLPTRGRFWSKEERLDGL